MARDLSAPRIADWVRYYKTAPEGYKPKALTAVLRADGQKMLAAVLKTLGLEQSVALVMEWEGEPSTASRPRKNVGESTDALPLEDVSGT